MKLSLMITGLFFVVSSFGLNAARSDEAVPLPAHPTEATYSWIQKNILTPKCVACHDEYRAYNTTMGSVTAKNAGNSDLYNSITSDGDMPEGCQPGTDCLSQDEQSAIYWWIQNGAENN